MDPVYIVDWIIRTTGKIYSDVWDSLSLSDKEKIIENLYKDNQNFKVIYDFNRDPDILIDFYPKSTEILITIKKEDNIQYQIYHYNTLLIRGTDKYDKPLDINLDLFSFDKESRNYLINYYLG